MTECKRNGCNQEAEIRPRYEGFCSLQCRDYHDYETEIRAYKTAWRELREWLFKKEIENFDKFKSSGDPYFDGMADMCSQVDSKITELEQRTKPEDEE